MWVVARFVFVQFERIMVATSQLSVVAEVAVRTDLAQVVFQCGR